MTATYEIFFHLFSLLYVASSLAFPLNRRGEGAFRKEPSASSGQPSSMNGMVDTGDSKTLVRGENTPNGSCGKYSLRETEKRLKRLKSASEGRNELEL